VIVMPANNTKWCVHYWQGKYGGLGHLYSIGSNKGPYPHLPFALDNGRFPAWSNDKEWSEADYIKLLRWCRSAMADGRGRPLWALVPDVVASKDATLAEWDKWAPRLREELPRIPLAFAAQDGMTTDDVPSDASVVFIGGTNDFKRQAIRPWCAHFPRVHVGRINTEKWLVECYEAGAESCDGTGWFRGDPEQARALEESLRQSSTNTVPRQERIFA
jgi:hypothetical protein